MERTFVGTGVHRFRVEPDWARLPGGEPFGIVVGVACDSERNVYVYARGARPVSVFAPDGRFLRSWGEGVILDAHTIHITRDDVVWLTDRDAHQVIACDPFGRVLQRLGERGVAKHEEPFNHPAGVAVDPSNGDVYVADGYGNARVHRFDALGRYLGGWGTRGVGPGEFIVPHGIWVDGGVVIVADRDNMRLQRFRPDGSFVDAQTGFFRPTSVHGGGGFLYVTDLSSRLTILEGGRIVSNVRIMVDGGHAVWRDAVGNLYVAEIHQGRVDRYTPEPA
jgi:DNA-binding beta-propeller fold protein YncE